ncbi:hypothetical protein ABIE59_000477 [Marinobacter sp. MBR-99]
MASVPAQTTATDVPATQDADAPESRSNLLLGFNRLNLLRQVGLMVGLAASVALGVAVVLWAQEPTTSRLWGISLLTTHRMSRPFWTAMASSTGWIRALARSWFLLMKFITPA